MDKMKDVSKLQEDWRNLLSSGRMTKKTMCDLVIPFRDKYRLTDGQALRIARNEISLSEINNLLVQEGIMKKVKFYLGTGFYGCSHEEITEYEDDTPDEVIDEDFEDWKNDRLDAQWWEMDE